MTITICANPDCTAPMTAVPLSEALNEAMQGSVNESHLQCARCGKPMVYLSRTEF